MRENLGLVSRSLFLAPLLLLSFFSSSLLWLLDDFLLLLLSLSRELLFELLLLDFELLLELLFLSDLDDFLGLDLSEELFL